MTRHLFALVVLFAATGLVACATTTEAEIEPSEAPSTETAERSVASTETASEADEAVISTALDAEAQASLTPDAVLAALKEGNERFVSGDMLQRDLTAQVKATSTGQYPHSVVLGCIDSRVPPEMVFDTGVGDIFSARVAGNFATPELLGSMEFATAVAGVKVVVVLGHSSCGAVKGACDKVDLGNVNTLVTEIAPSVEAAVESKGETCSSKNPDHVHAVAEHNVERTLEEIRTASPVMAELETAGKIKIVGAMYDLNTGKVTWYE